MASRSVLTPLVLTLGRPVVESFTCDIEFTLHTGAFLNAGQLTPFITSTLTITLALNLIATCACPRVPRARAELTSAQR